MDQSNTINNVEIKNILCNETEIDVLYCLSKNRE